MQQKTGKERILWVENLGFSILIVLAWLTELVRLPHLIYDEPFASNWGRAALRTVVVVGVWLWVHFETRRLLRRLHQLEDYLQICSWCRKIGDHGSWFSMEKYFGSKFDTQTSHGMCPECEEKMRQQSLANKATV